MNINDMYKRLNELDERIKSIQKQMDNFELDADDFEDEYEEILRAEYGTVNICGMTMDAVNVLKECDPTAFRNELLDYVNHFSKEDIPAYKTLESRLDDYIKEYEKLQIEIEEEESK